MPNVANQATEKRAGTKDQHKPRARRALLGSAALALLDPYGLGVCITEPIGIVCQNNPAKYDALVVALRYPPPNDGLKVWIQTAPKGYFNERILVVSQLVVVDRENSILVFIFPALKFHEKT